MKKLISLILVVLLCLPTVFVTVSADGADTYTITAASGANTTSNDYLNIYKYLAYYNGGDVITIPENYITVGQWKANIANPAINANGVADDAYVTSDCTLTFTMDDGVTTKNVEIDAVNYNQSFKKYDKKQSTTYAANDFGLTYGKGSKATVTVGNKIVSGSDYGLTMDVEVPSDATNMQGYVNVIQKLDTVKSITTPYIIDMTFKPESIQSLYRVSVGFMNSAGNGRAMSNLPNAVTNTIKASENVNISMVVFPKAGVMDIYVNGSLALENKNINDTTNSTTYADYNRLFVRFYNGTKVNNVYENLTFTITDYEIRSGYGKIDSPLYIAPEVEFLTYANGANVKVAEVEDITATVNDATYNTAELYVNGSRVSTSNVTNKAVTFSSSYLKPGTNELEVIMYKNGKKPVSTGKITITVQGDFVVEGISEGLFIHPDDFTGLVKVTANTVGFNKAELYIDGILKDTVYVSGTDAYLNAGTVEVGKYAFEVRLYPVAGEYITKTYNVELSTLKPSEIFEFEYTDDADESSDVYKNINKYIAYMEEELNIPQNYITVGQWKANIENPAIVAEGLSDDDYITSDCKLIWTAADGETTKDIYINVASMNYMYEEFDNTKPINVNSANSNNLKMTITMGTNGTLTNESTQLDDGKYVVNVDFDNFTGTTNPWNQVLQNLPDINRDIDTPYIIDMDIKFNSAKGYSSADFGFIGSAGLEISGKQRAFVGVTGFKGLAQSGNKLRFTAVVYPKANVADLYLNGSLVKGNHSLVFTDTLGTSSYEDYGSLFLRFYNKTKVDDEYQNMNYEISRYEIKYGFGNIDAETYIPPSMEITNYEDGASLTTENIVPLEAVTNSNDIKTAVLYIDGVKIAEEDVANKTVIFDMSSMGYGKHNVEVRMYPEIGEYISKSVTVNVEDFVNLSDYTITFDEFDAGETPSSLSKPAEYFGATNFINYSNESLINPSDVVSDAYVEYYDDVRGNVFHAKADPESNIDKTGRRIEITQSNTSNNIALNFDMMFESFSGVSYTFLATRGETENLAAKIGADGLLTMTGTTTSDTTSIQLETGVWYNFDAEFYCTMGGVVKLSVYDESGSLVGSMESLNGAPYTDRVRIYTPYNKSNLQSGEAYIDNVKTTIISTTGSIGEITATADDLNTVTAVLRGVSTVGEVELTGANGEIGILGYTYNTEDSKLTVSTAQPLDAYGSYTIKVYADGYGIPLTFGFEVLGDILKVKDSYFQTVKGENYVVLETVNSSEADGKMTVIITQWDGDKFISMNAKTITVAAGENKYNISVEDIENVKIMPVISLSKPILLSNGVIEK